MTNIKDLWLLCKTEDELPLVEFWNKANNDRFSVHTKELMWYGPIKSEHILVLDDHKVWKQDDEGSGREIATFLRSRLKNKVPLGDCLTSDFWRGRARAIVQGYAKKLLQFALDKAKAEADEYTKKAQEAMQKVIEITQELVQNEIVQEPRIAG